MKDKKPTYNELENQIAELKKENDFQKKQISNLIETNLDISKLKEIENELQKSYNLLSNLASQVPGVIYQYQLFPDGRSAFPYSSPGMYDIYEVTSEEVKEDASAVFTRIHPDDYNYIVESITQSARNLTVYNSEFRVILPKQGLRWRHCNAKPEQLEDGSTLWHGIITDITERKQIEQELIKAKEKAESNEQRLKFAAISGKLGIWDWNVKENIMVWDQKMFELYGINTDTFPNNIDLWISGLHPDDKQRAIDESNAALNGEKDFNTIFRVVHPNGKVLYLKADGLVIRDNENKPLRMIGINKDITENILAKEQIQLNSDILKNMVEGIYLVGFEDNIIKYSNSTFEKMFGYEPGEMIGKHVSIVNAPTDKTPIEAVQEIMKVINSTGGWSGEIQNIKKDGTVFWCHANVSIFKHLEYGNVMINTHQDITKRKQAEKELFNSNQRLELANSVADIGIWEMDYNSGTMLVTNKVWTDMYGLDNEDIAAQWDKNLHEDDREKTWKSVLDHFEGKTDKYIHEFRFKNPKTGIERWIRNVGKVIEYNKDKSPAKVLGVSIDITERKKAELELILAKEKAEESDRLKTAFLQNMSHEIRTPLNAISGFSGILNKPELSEEKRNSFVSIIQNSSKQLISIVTDILTISSLETHQEKLSIDKVCINNIIVDLLAIFKQQAQNQNISLYTKKQLSDKQSEIYTDKTKIIQILSNLLSNALKFTHEGFIEFGYYLKDNELEFYVKDSGIGIKPEFYEKIFERFRQADKSINKLYGGTGLGLSISKGFVELLGGRIWVQSELEKGSTFYFTIPYKPVNDVDKITTSTKQNENYKTIIVAEDEEYNFLYIEELLIDLHLKLIHTKDGKETVEIFKANPKIELILMDIKMPIMTGHEAAMIIKELKPDIPIVAQSAYALEHERAKYEEIFDDYLTKPINEIDLKQIVMKYIDIKKK